MTEAEFWRDLEYRLSEEFAGMPQRHVGYLWCDGFTPVRFLLEEPSPRITGNAWIVEGQEMSEWTFELFLNGPFASRENIDWDAHLPPANVTRWIAFDLAARHLQMEPSAAVPDLC